MDIAWTAFITEDFITMSFRLILAVILCGAIGFEREIKHHPAGFRTHVLVGAGSCIMMFLSLYGFEPYLNDSPNIRFDPARIPSYVISGIGFLGAGTILVRGSTVKGLTTAASIWVVAGIGLITGVGMYAPAILTTIVVLISLILLNKIEKKIFKFKNVEVLHIVFDKGEHNLDEIIETLNSFKIKWSIQSFKNIKDDEPIHPKRNIKIEVEYKSNEEKVQVMKELIKIQSIQKLF